MHTNAEEERGEGGKFLFPRPGSHFFAVPRYGLPRQTGLAGTAVDDQQPARGSLGFPPTRRRRRRLRRKERCLSVANDLPRYPLVTFPASVVWSLQRGLPPSPPPSTPIDVPPLDCTCCKTSGSCTAPVLVHSPYRRCAPSWHTGRPARSPRSPRPVHLPFPPLCYTTTSPTVTSIAQCINTSRALIFVSFCEYPRRRYSGRLVACPDAHPRQPLSP